MLFNYDSYKGYLIKQFCIIHLAYFKVFAITRNTIRNYLSFLVQFSSVIQSCPTLCDPMNCSILGFPVLHYLLEFAQVHVH